MSVEVITREKIATHQCLCILVSYDGAGEEIRNRCANEDVGPDEPFCKRCIEQDHDQINIPGYQRFLPMPERTKEEMA